MWQCICTVIVLILTSSGKIFVLTHKINPKLVVCTKTYFNFWQICINSIHMDMDFYSYSCEYLCMGLYTSEYSYLTLYYCRYLYSYLYSSEFLHSQWETLYSLVLYSWHWTPLQICNKLVLLSYGIILTPQVCNTLVL